MSWIDISVGIAVALVSDELLGWVDRLAKWLVRRNARRAPKHIADRLEEEWLAHLASAPGKISWLLFAIDCRRAAYVLSHQEHLSHVSPLVPLFVRLLDLFLTLLTLACLLPIIMLIAIAIRVEGNGPIFCYEERVGCGGRLFYALTFRTTHVDRPNVVVKALGAQGRRFTMVGRLLVRLNLVQLPWLLNVLLGEMSLVGPIPLRPQYAHRLCSIFPGYELRHSVRPGITGFAQIHWYEDVAVDSRKMAELDLFFVRNYSVHLVAAVMFGTVRLAFREYFNKAA